MLCTERLLDGAGRLQAARAVGSVRSCSRLHRPRDYASQRKGDVMSHPGTRTHMLFERHPHCSPARFVLHTQKIAL